MPLTSGITNKTYTITYRNRWAMVGGLLAQVTAKRNAAWWATKTELLTSLQAKNYATLAAAMVATVTHPGARAFSKIGDKKPLLLYRENAQATVQGILASGGTLSAAEAMITDTIRGYDVVATVGKQSLFMYLQDVTASVNGTHLSFSSQVVSGAGAMPVGAGEGSISLIFLLYAPDGSVVHRFWGNTGVGIENGAAVSANYSFQLPLAELGFSPAIGAGSRLEAIVRQWYRTSKGRLMPHINDHVYAIDPIIL
ncbi:hypothetical protein [Runella sp.]|uniref:hypothetical protein n=1 Tax=Runella sp. TaxID=1960881 RepID=UPI002615A7F8|nr:hypothetical protein [Runella sp.]